MRKILWISVLLCICFGSAGCVFSKQSDEKRINMKDEIEEKTNEKLGIRVGGNFMTAIYENNSSAKALRDELAKGTITVKMNDYGNFEKVGSLGMNLPTNDKQITTKPGDIILYQGNQLTIYYDTNSWNFTRIAKIENISKDELKEILGDGDVEVTLEAFFE